MKSWAISFVAGGLFGAGLLISQMTNPSKVIAFLDIFGNWDPSLALVMASALVVTFLGYRFVLKQPKPVAAISFSLPKSKNIDGKLVTGAALFGAGWGLVGLCPGPALSASTFAGTNIVYFLAGMIGTIVIYRWLIMRNPVSKQAD